MDAWYMRAEMYVPGRETVDPPAGRKAVLSCFWKAVKMETSRGCGRNGYKVSDGCNLHYNGSSGSGTNATCIKELEASNLPPSLTPITKKRSIVTLIVWPINQFHLKSPSLSVSVYLRCSIVHTDRVLLGPLKLPGS
ncbi:hypothetical protein ACLOJK_011155 [Asimina triloba]